MAGGFTITISAVDKASARMNDITKRINAMNAPVRKFRGAFGRFMDATGVRRVAGAFRDWSRAGLQVAGSLLKIVEPMGILTGAASLAGLYKLTTAWAQFGTRLGFDAQRIGIMPQKLQALQGAAEEAGASAGSMTTGLRSLHDNMVDAIGGRNNEALLYFRQLRINIGSMRGGVRSVTDVLPELADKIARIREPTLQARVATQLLGAAGEELLPYLRRGSKGMQQLEADSRYLGVTNQKGVQAAYDLQLAQTRLGMATRGLAYSIAEQAGPGLKSLLDWFTNLIAKNREAIAARIGQAVQTFAKWLMSINWQQVGDEIGQIADDAQDVAKSLGGWKETAKDVGKVIMALLITRVMFGLGMMMARIVQVTAAIKAMRAASSAADLADAAGAAASGGGSAAAAAAAGGTGILSRLGRYGRTGLRWGGRALGGVAMAGLAYDIWNNVFTGGDHLASNDTTIHGSTLNKDIAAQARLAAAKYGLDPDRFTSLLQTEGGGYDRVSPAGAFGPAQLMPKTAAGLGLPDDIHAPGYSWQGNLDGGARYFRQMLDLFHGNYNAAEAAYNAGPFNAGVKRYAATGDPSGLPDETQNYVQSINALTSSARRMNGSAKSDGSAQGSSWNDFSRRMTIDLRVHNDGHPQGARVSVKGARMAGGGPAPKISTAMPTETM
ncbi:lytic transglycosylase domain-containing protein [Komagataeibacter xylinus]|uniref:Lytic transglycosylase domain-containing protein n=1 Tax=Komagataeibacter xylinus TaxID=28448 RepID=A0A857FQI7_KOMXY|nr:lytic transglycosylase domain-containing protein [Komagataeibacter xylinus]QHC36462.1 lytic transglycosylase domain-containing protein [Komagataeibacter xylinus]